MDNRYDYPKDSELGQLKLHIRLECYVNYGLVIVNNKIVIITTEAHPCACYLARLLRSGGVDVYLINQVSPTVPWGTRIYFNRLLKRRGLWVFLDNFSYKIFIEAKMIFLRMAMLTRKLFKNWMQSKSENRQPDDRFSKLPDLPALKPDPGLQNEKWLHWFDIERINNQTGRSLLTSIGADLCLLAGAPILDSMTIAVAGTVCLNTHCGITPNYAGSDPIVWTLINEDWKNIGFSIHYVIPQVDSGPLVYQERVAWSPRWPIRYIEHFVVQRMYDKYAQIAKDFLEARILLATPQSVMRVRPPAGIFSRIFAVMKKTRYTEYTGKY